MANISNINNALVVSNDGALTIGNPAPFNANPATDTRFTFPTTDGTANQILKTNGAGILTFVDDENSGGNVTGSGTLNKVARWTATGDDLGDGPILFSSSAATANSTFGGGVTVNAGNGDQLILNNAGERFTQISLQNNGTTEGALWVDDTDNEVVLYANTGKSIEFHTDGSATPKLTIASGGTATFAGNVGIGSAPVGNPATKFLAVGTAGSVAGGIQLWAGSAQTHFLQFGVAASGTGYYKGAISYAHGTNTLALLQNAVTALSFTGSQNATFAGEISSGDDINCPTKIVIGESASPEIRLKKTDAGTASIRFYSDNTQEAYIMLDATEHMVYYGAANVGQYFYANTVLNETKTGANSTFAGTVTTSDVYGTSSLRTAALGGIHYVDASSYLSFRTGASFTERMRIDSAGDVGIGTTPYTAGSTWRSFYVGGSASIISRQSAAGVDSMFSNNLYIDSANADKRRTTGGAARIFMNDDIIRFQNIGSAASNTAISFVERMRIDANGNVGIGTTSPDAKLSIYSTATFDSRSSGVNVHRPGSFGQYGSFSYNSDTTYFSSTYTGGGASFYGSFIWEQFNNGSVGREAMRITSDGQILFQRTGQPPITNSLYGNIVLGSDAVTNFQRIRYDVGSTAYWGLTKLNTGNFAITGGSTWNDHALEIQYATQNVQINETVGQRRLNIYDGTDAWVRLYCGSTADWIFGANGSDHTFKWYNQSTDGGVGYKMQIATSGTLTVSGDVVAYGTPSDIRLKENIKPIDSALDKVIKLQGVTFDWIQKEGQILEIKEDIGFIAQDVQKIVPELVRENKDGMLSMRHQGIAPILLEAIKELKQEIEELKSKQCNCDCKK